MLNSAQYELVWEHLGNVLSLLRAQYLNYQTLHWQTSGQNFYSSHLLFQRIYTKIGEETDALAEKLIGLLENPESVNLQSQIERISSHCQAWGSPENSTSLQLFDSALRSEKHLQAAISLAYNSLKDSNSITLGLDDMLMSLASDHESNLYLLQQSVRSTPRVASLVTSSYSAGEAFMILASDPKGDLHLLTTDRRVSWHPREKRFRFDQNLPFRSTAPMPRSVSLENPKTGNVALFKYSRSEHTVEGALSHHIFRNDEHGLDLWLFRKMEQDPNDRRHRSGPQYQM